MTIFAVCLAALYALTSSSGTEIGPCADADPGRCAHNIEWGSITGKDCNTDTWTKENCPLSCGLCEAPAPICEDEFEEEWCNVAEMSDLCGEFFYEDRCKRTCGFCDLVANPPCEDESPEYCQSSDLDCYKSRSTCMKTCGACNFYSLGICADDLNQDDCESRRERNMCSMFRYDCRRTCGVCGRRYIFPIGQTTSSIWSWADDGTNESLILKLNADGSLTWREGEEPGTWRLINSGTSMETFTNGGMVLEIEFDRNSYKLEYDGDKSKAILISPVRSPFSTMTLISSSG